jgi:glycerol-3-phosphate acyltransferase PlsY
LTDYVIIILVAYLLGSVPWGYLIPRLLRGIDIRQYGSGNIGMANVLRTVGGALASLVLLLDVGKGALSVLIAWWLTGHSPVPEVVAGFMALIGHDYPVFLKFKGGRGVATGLGCTFVMAPYVALIASGAFTLIVLRSRYISLGSVAAAAIAPALFCVFAAFGMYPWIYLYFMGIGGAIVIYQHRGNIKRLIQGTERKVGEPSVTAEPTDAKGA